MTIERGHEGVDGILRRWLAWAIHHPVWMLALALMLLMGGVYAAQHLPMDAVPDITNVQVQVNTEAPGYSPLEVEQRITYPIETALAGIPRLEGTRSLSRYGLSQVTVVFEDGTDMYFARQRLSERLLALRSQLPEGLEPTMGPIATGLGEIVMYLLEADPAARTDENQPYSAMDLQALQQWVVLPQLRQVKGVAEVNSIGGYEKQIHILPHPAKLMAYNLTLTDVQAALEAHHANSGAGYIEQQGAQYLVRVPGQVASLDDIRQIPVAQRAGVPLRLEQVADVRLGYPLRTGAATHNGQEVVLGTVMMLMGENSRLVAKAAVERLQAIQQGLPEGVHLRVVYDRTELVNRTIATVQTNLLEGALLVIAVLFFLLGHLRAALLTASVIPLAMAMTMSGMVAQGISGNLMSLGALDFGLIVDGAVIIVENGLRRLRLAQQRMGRTLTRQERIPLMVDATAEVVKPSVFGVVIITVVYIPMFALTGVEGKMFHPMAWTVVMALLAALVLSVSFIPSMLAWWIQDAGGGADHTAPESGQRWMLWYQRRLWWAMRNPVPVAVLAVVMVLMSVGMASRMGAEFIPQLDEGDVALHALRIPGTSLSQSVAMQRLLEERLKQVPEVHEVFTKIGTADVATDPMPPSVADTFVMLHPREKWPDPRKPKAQLWQELEAAAQAVPGNNYEFTQPIQMRFNELLSGVRSDVAVKLFGDDMQQLHQLGQQVEAMMQEVAGAADVKLEQVTGLPMLSIIPNREALARYGVSIVALQNVMRTALAGQDVGTVFEGDRRVEMVIRLPERWRSHPKAWENLPVPLPVSEPDQGERRAMQAPRSIPLKEVATIHVQEGPNQISREQGKRRVVVTANIRGRDVAGFVQEVQRRMQQTIALPVGYWVDMGGTYEQWLSARDRLMWVVPLALALIVGLLWMAFGRLRVAMLIFSGVPLALTGGVLALWLRGIPLSISAGVGFIALSGVAVLNGVVMVSFIQQLRREGVPLDTAIEQGAMTRLRPIMMTALVASLGFVPMALNVGAGAEVQRPLATVVIGGIVSSTLLTLLVLPALYRWLHRGCPE